MKSKLIIAILLLCFSIGLCIFESITINKITNEATEVLAAIKEKDVINDNEKLIQLTGELYEFFEDKAWVLEAFIHHEETQELIEAAGALRAAALAKDKASYFEELAKVTNKSAALSENSFSDILLVI